MALFRLAIVLPLASDVMTSEWGTRTKVSGYENVLSVHLSTQFSNTYTFPEVDTLIVTPSSLSESLRLITLQATLSSVGAADGDAWTE